VERGGGESSRGNAARKRKGGGSEVVLPYLFFYSASPRIQKKKGRKAKEHAQRDEIGRGKEKERKG